MRFQLGELARSWNELAGQNTARGGVERTLYRNLTRELMPCLKSSEFRVLSFIYSRTLMWQKFAEAIPFAHFIRGITDATGEPRRDSRERIISTGCGIKKEETTRLAVVSLCKKGLIEYIPGDPRSPTPANTYFCCPITQLGRLYLDEGGGILPPSHEFLKGEHLFEGNTDDGEYRVYRVSSIQGGVAELWKVDKRLRETGRPILWTSAVKLYRPTLDKWICFKSRIE